MRTLKAFRVAQLFGFCLLLGFAGTVQASLVQFEFDVDVTSRSVLDDGNYLADWQSDTAFPGSGFSLAVLLDTTALVSERSNFRSFYRHVLTAPISGALSTPFDAEMEAVLTHWPGLGLGDASITFEQRLDADTGIADLIVRFIQSVGPVGDTPDIIDSTRQAQRATFLNLFLVDQAPVLGPAAAQSGALLELQDLIDYVSTPTLQFAFSQNAAQNEGAYTDIFLGGGIGQGVRYDGTARFASVEDVPSPVPAPSALWLIGIALGLLKHRVMVTSTS